MTGPKGLDKRKTIVMSQSRATKTATLTKMKMPLELAMVNHQLV